MNLCWSKALEFISRIFSLAKPHLKIDFTEVNLNIREYEENEIIKALDIVTNADEWLSSKRSQQVADLIESRKDDEVPFVIFTADLRCHECKPSRNKAPLDNEETEIAANFAAINSYNGSLRFSTMLEKEIFI